MTIHWKAVEQYSTVVLLVYSLTARVKPWVIQSFLTLDSTDRTMTVTIHWKAVEQYFTVVLFLSRLALSGVKGLSKVSSLHLAHFSS